jgi:hypothetical protein
MVRAGGNADHDHMANVQINSKQTAAFFAQAVISFGVALLAISIGIAYLPVNGWMRGFLMLGVLYTVTSAFTLAKVIRDQHEASNVIHRIDEARLERFLTDHNPFSNVS